MHEHPLDRDHVRAMLGHQRADRGVDALQAHHHVATGHVDAAAGNVALAAGTAVDDAKAGALRARIEPEHPAVAMRPAGSA